MPNRFTVAFVKSLGAGSGNKTGIGRLGSGSHGVKIRIFGGGGKGYLSMKKIKPANQLNCWHTKKTVLLKG